MNQLTIKERKHMVKQGFQAHCDAYETGCNCDLCRSDDQTAILEEWVKHEEACECAECMRECNCESCMEDRRKMSEAEL